jgi:hypothetical protein
MTCNMGKKDRIFRMIIGLAIAGLGFYFGAWWGLLAIVPLGTAIVGYCPAYGSLKWSTIGVKK